MGCTTASQINVVESLDAKKRIVPLNRYCKPDTKKHLIEDFGWYTGGLSGACKFLSDGNFSESVYAYQQTSDIYKAEILDARALEA